MKEKLGCLAIFAVIIGIIVLIVFLSDAWSSPKEVDAKIEATLRQAKINHLYFEDQEELWAYVEKQGYSKNQKEVLQKEYDAGYEEGYNAGCSDGYTQGDHAGYAQGWEDGYRDGYAEGYSDCEDGVPYVER